MQPIGRLTLNANPTNFFAETEQVAFHVGHLVPGIDVTDDPLMQARLFSYVDTQLTRLGGPNFNQIPINRPHAPVNDMLRDGFHQHAVHGGVAPYKPNSLDGGCPFFAGADGRAIEGAFVDSPVRVAEATKVRANPASYDDHYSQARQFWLSMTPVEKEHIVRAYTFELGKCYEQAIKERQLLALANIDPVLCQEVATGLGLPAPKATIKLEELDAQSGPVAARRRVPAGRPHGRHRHRSRRRPRPASAPCARPSTPPAWCRCSSPRTAAPWTACRSSGPSPPAGPWSSTCCWWPARRSPLLTRCPHATRRRAPTRPAAVDPRVLLMLEECYRHAKVIGAWGGGVRALDAARCTGAAGVVTGDDAATVFAEVQTLMSAHRVWERFPSSLA